jgi:hypothetical protein
VLAEHMDGIPMHNMYIIALGKLTIMPIKEKIHHFMDQQQVEDNLLDQIDIIQVIKGLVPLIEVVLNGIVVLKLQVHIMVEQVVFQQ